MAAVVEPPSPSSPFSWRLRDEQKGSSSTSSSNSSKNQKSYGIAPNKFHAKKSSNKDDTDVDNYTNKEESWKEEVERNLLIREHKNHANDLEAKRKAFRRRTQLKTWPLQEMA